MSPAPRRPAERRALLVVEDEFLTRHVGVRRVIGHYWDRLNRSGFQVDIAAPQDSVLTLAADPDVRRARETVLAAHPGSSSPVWTSRDDEFPEPGSLESSGNSVRPIAWTGEIAHVSDYQVSVLTNPWMCARDVPPDAYTHGITYDLVPNLVSAGALDLGEFVDVVAFAHEHHLGFQFLEQYAATIACISECTRADLLRFYLRDEPGRAVVDVPFDSRQNGRAARARGRSSSRTDDHPAHVLLVNPLDHRKNLVGIRETLLALAEERPLRVSVVGRERMPWHAAVAFFRDLTDAGVAVEWFRGASDARLEALYDEADALLFPSLYEGLGLPILEAQAHGLPVVSSSTSSCGEINLNPELTAEPTDVDGVTAAMRACLDGDGDVLSGGELREALDRFIEVHGRGLPWGREQDLDHAGPAAVTTTAAAAG